jgi:hypothetical protein
MGAHVVQHGGPPGETALPDLMVGFAALQGN